MSNKTISIFAIDDDKTFLLLLERMTKSISIELDMVILLSAYTELPSYLSINEFNLFFVDVEMPELDGFTLANKIMESGNAKIVFVTANSDYVFDSFRYKAYDFIRKSHFESDLKRVLSRYISDCMSAICIYVQESRVEIPLKEILIISVRGNYLWVCTTDKKYRIRSTLKDFLVKNSICKHNCFIKINQSEIINMDRILNVSHNEIQMENQQTVFISRSNRKTFYKKYSLYESGK